MSSKPHETSAKELAELTGLTERRIRQLATDKILPGAEKSRFPFTASLKALFAYFRREGESLKSERLKLTAAKRRLAEAKLDEVAGRLIPLAVVEKLWNDRALAAAEIIRNSTVGERDKKELREALIAIPATEYQELENLAPGWAVEEIEGE